MVHVLMNKVVFEPSDDYLKVVIPNHNSFQMSQTHLHTNRAQLSEVKLDMELRTAGAVGPIATLSNKKSVNNQLSSSAVAYLLSMHKALRPVH